jgi:signal transduction histidine kinase
MPHRSLTFRLAATSVIWLAGSLLAAGLLLVLLFRDHIERRFDRQLFDNLQELVAASEVQAGGAFALTWMPSDPRFNLPYSGWYWQIGKGDEVVARSESLWHSRLLIAPPRPGTSLQVQRLVGPAQAPLRALVTDITLPDGGRHFSFVVAGPIGNIESDIWRFAGQLSMTLGVLGVGLFGAVFLQVRFGLRPLRGLQRALADIRSGRVKKLPESFPEEVQPVVSELNAMLGHDAMKLERARTQAGNLAHALKNPLTVIRNEAREVAGERGEILREQAAAVSEHIDHYLSYARAAGAGDVLGARAAVGDAVEDLRFTMALLHKDRGLEMAVSLGEQLFFRGDAHDLEEMLGNLMDNACKWARERVAVGARQADGRLLIAVEDDGPGIPDERLAEVIHRGGRLDERVPGSGLGLAIVHDLAELYSGALTLGASPLGGLRAELDLPAAE